MRPSLPLALSLAVVAGLLAPACKGSGDSGAGPSGSASGSSSSAPLASATASAKPAFTAPGGPVLGVIVGQANILADPHEGARRIGYLRLGSIVSRDEQPAGKAGCPAGWYKVAPRGYVCSGPEATTDANHPVLRAAAGMKPDRNAAMPYRYGFVRAVLPLYLRAANREDQEKSEFKLKEHLAKWDTQKDELNKVVLGAYDVPLDERGVPIPGKKVGDVARPSTTWSQAELFGASGEDDPVPWWLEGSRKIPNLADFKVPEYAAFADRARRHTGLAFIGSFKMGAEGFERRFAITTDLRLAPTSKVKPDTGSPWHGIELIDPAKSPPLPFAWVRVSDSKAYKLVDGKAKEKGDLEKRSIVLLTGKRVSGPDGFYWELKNGMFIKAAHAAVVKEPIAAEWPEAAKKGQKWIDVSIDDQTLVLWQGQKPVFATMVSTGQDKMGDPKTTKSTVRGTFTIKSKHVTATMDSNEGSSAGGRRASSGKKREKSPDDEPAPKKAKSVDDDKGKKSDRDPEYGVTKRRGEGTFWLRDVPYVQFFEAGYALHVAYWHDVFGIARSHGCINLSPLDGKYVFGFTDPPTPEGWHGVMSGAEFGEGTTIWVHGEDPKAQ